MARWLIVLGLLIVVVSIGGAGYGVWTIWQQHHQITSARPVPAKVVAHKTEDLKASGFVAKVPLVTYEYTVDQQPYTCQTVTPDELMLPDTWAETVFKQFPVGAQTQAYYDPNDPAKAFLVAKYSIKPYLPLLISLVIAALGLGIVVDQVFSQETPTLSPTNSGGLALGAKQHHLARARVEGIVGLIGLVCGAPPIWHHLSVSTSPHERMGFLMEGGYAIAVLTLLTRSALQFRRGSGFGTPVVTVDRSPAIGQSLQLKLSIPTRFTGTASLDAVLKCEAKDTKLFQLSEESADVTLVKEQFLSVPSESVTQGDELTRTVDLSIPDHMPPSTPVDSAERIHVVWSLILSAEGSGGRTAETEYFLSVANAAS
jgi:hypothetical protein